jgi:hypothetical protein
MMHGTSREAFLAGICPGAIISGNRDGFGRLKTPAAVSFPCVILIPRLDGVKKLLSDAGVPENMPTSTVSLIN